MIDRTLDIFLMVIFGTGGIVVLTLAWIQPISLSERILTTSVGSAGLLWVLIRLLLLRSVSTKIPAEVEVDGDSA